MPKCNRHTTNKVKVANERDPSKSIWKIAQEVGVNRTTVRQILKRLQLGVLQIFSPLKTALSRRAALASSSLLTKEVVKNRNLLKQVWFSDEAHFHPSGGGLTEQSNPQDMSHREKGITKDLIQP